MRLRSCGGVVVLVLSACTQGEPVEPLAGAPDGGEDLENIALTDASLASNEGIEFAVSAERCVGVDIGSNFLGLATRAPSNPDALSYPGFKVDMYQELGVDVVRFPGGEVSNNYM
ncbi:MAG: hypothetical protein AAF654_14625, partial [Myxococcota bacterium]